MFQLIYLSTQSVPFDREALDALLKQARARNSSLGITGILLHLGNNFVQALEGEESAVRGLYEKICRDPRHHEVTLLLAQGVLKNDFDDWSMAFHDISSEDAHRWDGLSDFLRVPWDRTIRGLKTSRGLRILEIFRYNYQRGIPLA